MCPVPQSVSWLGYICVQQAVPKLDAPFYLASELAQQLPSNLTVIATSQSIVSADDVLVIVATAIE